MLVGLSGNGVELVALLRKKGRYASHTIAVGASGAIFALGGTLVALVPKVKVIVVPVSAPMPLWIAIIGGFLVLMIIPNVVWQAHLGG